MSGLEVLGAITGVLGILPVAVDALKTYKSIISSIRNAARDLASLIRDLETERIRLQTTCEVLLEGVAPFHMVDCMAKDPFGAAWEQYSPLLRLRLWESESSFKNHTLDMNIAATELKRKLCIYGDSSPKLADKVSIIRELKKGVSFTLNKKDYIGIVSRIKLGNLALSELARNNRGLEAARRQRSQARLIKLVRGLSDGIFQAIQNSTTCECVTSHRVCLELVTRDAVLTPNDLDDDVARSFKFHVAFTSDNNMENLGCSVVLTLREVLDGEWLKVARFGYWEKLQIALAIAVNTLHLYNTPWVDENLTLDSVIFFLPSSGEDLDTKFLARPFVVKNVLTPHRKQDTLLRAPRPINWAAFWVGALLVQVLIGKIESALDVVGPMDVPTIISKRNAGKQLLDEVLWNSSFNCRAAIEWCFEHVLDVAGLGNEKCCQEFFQEQYTVPTVLSNPGCGSQILIATSVDLLASETLYTMTLTSSH
ncbi:uncharacterized protein TRIVIDRAFT_67590 [Trichoderma virens Gv29-8]|uniref:Uncharacterized protein n=1 Tax=Hypocrea virens (strain Gv29-8 / FGSC 10586) TaxID=413071 RepID=G9MPZ5_HYPVG|nr:uncharacterized protein TRIVIDRAFT_67590 [Trichoderma virens Gv29-8]EHK23944.1 hypothetical protein TRIVIDRAFT_67590 [Trichoderma virens Gv29-8]UKZ50251.1 hypothetical protein TrVGV298_004508 [Trichoderma virens]